MTRDEYYKVCRIIEEHIKTEWISSNYQRHSITLHGVAQIKEELKDLVKE